MLSSFLSSTPQPVEELHWGNWIIIVIAFILYCASLTLVTYFLLYMISTKIMIDGAT